LSENAVNVLFLPDQFFYAMILFDFLYYSLYRFYSDFNEKGASSTAAGIVGGIQAVNILIGIFLYKLLFRKEAHIDGLLGIGLFVVFQIFTYYRYIYKDFRSIEVMEEKWSSKSTTFRRQMSTILFFYVAISVVGCFGLAIYIGSRN
jgi:uncharacterized membrane protein